MTAQCLMLSKTLCQDLDTPVSLGVYLRQKYGGWDDYLSMRIDPAHYLDTTSGALEFFKDTQAVAFLKKFPNLPVKRDLDKEARDAFFVLERKNATTNCRLDRHIGNYGLTTADSKVCDLIDDMRRVVARILGALPRDLHVRFGKGAVFESAGHRFAQSLTIADKMTMSIFTTKDALPLVDSFIMPTLWGRAVLQRPVDHLQIVRGSRFGTVPKDATKHRHINVEPGANVALQLAIGREIRGRLKRVGIDLNNGQDLHRAEARKNSLSGDYATFDLSNASDLISHSLVRLLLPEDWFMLLESVRSPFTKVGKQWVRLEKFSSMGNGYTFELETLIFYAILKVITGGEKCLVYGDDMIFPSKSALDVRRALEYFGLEINVRKSFSLGPFRESCGGDFFNGLSVRPFYLDFEPNEPHEFITLCNGLRRAALQVTGPMGRQLFRRVWRRAAGFIPAVQRRCTGPSALGDLVLQTHPSYWNTKSRSQIRYFRVWRPVAKKIAMVDTRWEPSVQLAAILYGCAEGGLPTSSERFVSYKETYRPDPLGIYLMPSGTQMQKLQSIVAFLVPRNGVSGYRFGRVPYS